MDSFDDKIVIGLTGMSGAGKTTVSKIFETNGFEVINCDLLARSVIEKGKPCYNETVNRFGKEIVSKDGALDRNALAKIVFSDSGSRSEYNLLIYPYITYEIIELILKSKNRYILLDAPTLFESGVDGLCSKIVSVVTSKSLERIIKRDCISEEMAKMRLSSQHDREYYITRSDFYIDNDNDIRCLDKAAERVLKELL